MSDLKWTKNDLINSRPTVEMFGIPRENVTELIDCTNGEVQKAHKGLKERIREHAEKEEYVFVYVYAAGHGLGGVRQYLLLNEPSIDLALFDIEEDLRSISTAGKGKCFVLAVFDMCRIDASKYKVLSDERKDQLQKERMAAKYGRGGDN